MKFPRQVPGIPRSSEWHELSEDVVYAEAGGVPLRYDHYRPKKVDGLAPGIVFVHGGAWVHGDPSQAAGNALHFARHGIATVSLSYRLAPRHRFPAALDDVRRGLRHVRAHAEELGIDANRIVLLGLSAGAHLAMLSHVASQLPELEADLPPELRDVREDVLGVMLHYGPYDLARRFASPLQSIWNACGAPSSSSSSAGFPAASSAACRRTDSRCETTTSAVPWTRSTGAVASAA